MKDIHTYTSDEFHIFSKERVYLRWNQETIHGGKEQLIVQRLHGVMCDICRSIKQVLSPDVGESYHSVHPPSQTEVPGSNPGSRLRSVQLLFFVKRCPRLPERASFPLYVQAHCLQVLLRHIRHMGVNTFWGSSEAIRCLNTFRGNFPCQTGVMWKPYGMNILAGNFEPYPPPGGGGHLPGCF